MGDVLSPSAVKLASALAVLGAIVALIAALFGGASWLAWLYRPLIAAVFMAALGFAIHLILKTTAPEIVEAFEDSPPVASEITSETDDGTEDPGTEGEGSLTEMDTESAGGGYDDSMLNSSSSSSSPRRANKDVKAGDGEIVVEGVKLKNEPKVMAEAIKHLMDQDEDAG